MGVVSDVLPQTAADLLDVDPDDFDSDEALREYLDEKLAAIEAAGAGRDDRLDAQDARDDALAAQLDTVREEVEDAQRRAKRAERLAAWGGLGYEDRLETVVDELIRRARAQNGAAYITTAEEDREDVQGNRYKKPGIYDLFDGAVSKRTARNYMDDLGAIEGLSTADAQAGGWGGGSEQRRLKILLARFLDAHGADYDIRAALDGVNATGGD